MRQNKNRFAALSLILVLVGIMSACATTQNPVPSPAVVHDDKVGTAKEYPSILVAAENDDGSTPPLRVGISPNYPPVIFESGGSVAGIEVDLARNLARRLKRSLELIRVRWDRQIPSLVEGRTDLIMSGMTATTARKVRVDFADPYMKSGLLAAIRKEDEGKYANRKAVLNAALTIGVIEGTTGDAFIQKELPTAPRTKVSDMKQAIYMLKDQRSVDIFVHDAAAVIWAISESEGRLTAYWRLLTDENLAWAVRREDQALKAELNAALGGMRADGSLESIRVRWLPYYRQLEGAN